jgi:putative ABC transport system permease protein
MILYREGASMQEGKDVRMNYVDTRFLQTLNIKPVAGRIFSDEFPADTNNRIILNENAIKAIGLSSAQQAIGKRVYFDFNDSTYNLEIVGVVKDFHYEDLHLPITPYGFQLNGPQAQYNYMIVHAKPGNISSVLQIIQSTWHSFNSSEPFEYSFLDADFQKNYEAEDRLASIVGYFTAIAILISCLGLFGLASFSAEQRIKEIGVRKVLGASVTSIVALLSKDFLKLVAIAIVIASPLAWWAMHKWLLNFAYRINVSWFVFVITAFAALFIALLTISFQAIRAAVANPVKSLRTE